MKSTEKIDYALACALLYPLSVLPLRLLYFIADVVMWIGGYLFGYRRKVIRENLRIAFPDHTETWRRNVEKEYYRFLGDYVAETVKLLTISPGEMKRRMRFENVEVVNRALESGRNVVLYLGHYCNWEWVSSMPLWLPREGCVPAQVYHPLHNKGLDHLFYRLRTRFNASNIPMKDIMRFLIDHKRAGIPTITGFIADQSPWLNHHHFATFFNRETGWYTGPERIAGFLQAEVYYCHMSRPRRGEYVLRFDTVTLTPRKEPMFGITDAFIRMLEANIRENPGYYLWSHRRWKHSRQEFNDYWGDKAAEQLTHL